MIIEGLYTVMCSVIKCQVDVAVRYKVIIKESLTLNSPSEVVEEPCYKPEGLGFETRWGELIFSIYLILPAALGPGVYSASNRNEYQKQRNNVSVE
jgi:hypothetical protein